MGLDCAQHQGFYEANVGNFDFFLHLAIVVKFAEQCYALFVTKGGFSHEQNVNLINLKMGALGIYSNMPG